jgi:hypothetical protein
MLTVRFNYTQLFELVRQQTPENQADLCAFLIKSKFNLVGTRQCRVPTVFHNSGNCFSPMIMNDTQAWPRGNGVLLRYYD